ncbi:MAG TPA: peptidoglycan editing factor PgeF [Edaphobacter sp.]|nr:peptidoglycan editing factor PgeF [Edaphobacter sp.]
MDIEKKELSRISVQIPQWSVYPWLRHGFSTRAGGVSTTYGPDSLNLGWTKEDDPASVTANRRRLMNACWGNKIEGVPLVTVRQIHSAVVWPIREQDGVWEGKLQTPEGKAVLEGDGLMTDVPGIMLGVQTADCVPVLIADVNRRVVAAFHAGWRGTAAGIVEQGVARMRSDYGSCSEDLIAAVGPSIGACCYPVGDEVRTSFMARFDYAEQLFRTKEGKTYLDLWEANRRQLLDAGVASRKITVVGECTACGCDVNGARKYFSHRADHGVTGRMMSVVGVEQSQ